jgi:hypothetical protein
MRVAMALATVLAAVLGQASPGALAGFWAASLGGQTFVRLELHETNGAVSGRISLGDIHVNAHGDVDQVIAPARAFTPIFAVALRDGALSFARKDGDDTDRFSLRPSAAGFAELTFSPSDEDRRQLAEAGIPIPKPIRLTRAGP